MENKRSQVQVLIILRVLCGVPYPEVRISRTKSHPTKHCSESDLNLEVFLNIQNTWTWF